MMRAHAPTAKRKAIVPAITSARREKRGALKEGGGGATVGSPAIVSSQTATPSAPRSPRTKVTFGSATVLPLSPGGGGVGAATAASAGAEPRCVTRGPLPSVVDAAV